MFRRDFLKYAASATFVCPQSDWQVWSHDTWLNIKRSRVRAGDLLCDTDHTLWICNEFGTPRPAFSVLAQAYDDTYVSTSELLLGSSNQRGLWCEIHLIQEDTPYRPIEYGAGYYGWQSSTKILKQIIVDIGVVDLSVCKHVWSLKPCLELGRVCSPHWEKTRVR